MVFVLGLIEELARSYIVDICRTVFTTSYQISIAVRHRESNLHVSILVLACKLAHWITYSQIPQLDRAVSATSQKRIKRINISERAFVEFYSVCVALVAIVHSPYWLICASVVDYEFFVGASDDADS